jgi:hypothetical protein
MITLHLLSLLFPLSTLPLHPNSTVLSKEMAISASKRLIIPTPHLLLTRIPNTNGIPYYGRTHSGMSVYPVENYHLPLHSRPSIRYDFYSITTGEVDFIFHIGPTNNYVLGSKLAFAVQVDEGEMMEIEPIPEAAPGHLSADWEEIVANEIREVKVKVKLDNEGSHILRVFGITSGIVLERVMIDLGGIAARGYSYLGPVESVIL